MNTDSKLAGILIFIGAAQFLIFMQISEFIYPKYSVANNYISDLGVGPSAAIFNSSIVILGLLGLIAALLLYKIDKVFSILLFLASIGAIGVGIFPETTGILHTISSLITFLFGGIAAIYSCKMSKGPLRYIWIILGIFSLIALGLFIPKYYLGLGHGGMERLIVYPVLMWLLGFSSELTYLKSNK